MMIEEKEVKWGREKNRGRGWGVGLERKTDGRE